MKLLNILIFWFKRSDVSGELFRTFKLLEFISLHNLLFRSNILSSIFLYLRLFTTNLNSFLRRNLYGRTVLKSSTHTA